MTISQWFSFQGRLRRRHFWLLYVLPLIVAHAAATALDATLGFITLKDIAPEDGYGVAAYGMGPFMIVVGLVNLWAGLAAQVKRWHDRDKSGWWVLIALVPLIGQIWALVVVGFLAGTPGPNRFGPDPRV
ncbi:DUF805 domain-containing protein [Humitalea sp. 24SJ18S-53]|uniref:DUF805 domain-containing protein n=1 Tax=Humitalea sp. 24SJ18S-53 TaxID=3422307 RepID=UPI003D66F8CB